MDEISNYSENIFESIKHINDYGEKIVLRPDSTNSEHKEQVYEKGKDTIAIQGKVIFIKSYTK